MEVYELKENEKIKRRVDKYRNLSNDVIAAHLSPLHNASLRAVETVKAALRPSVVKIVKFGLQQVIKPEGERQYVALAANMFKDARKLWQTLDLGMKAALHHNPEELEKQASAASIVAMIKNLAPLANYSDPLVLAEENKSMNYSLLNITDVLAEAQRSSEESFEKVQALMQEAFEEVDLRLNQSVPTLPRKIRIMPRLRHPLPEDSGNSTAMLSYFVDKALPVLLGKVFPKLAVPVSLLLNTPAVEPNKTMYIMQQIVPYLQTHQMESFDLLPPRGDPPKKRCVTCQEQYEEMVKSTENPNSCMSHCMPLAAMCFTGLDSQCIHQIAPCLRCHSNRLAQLDACLGEEYHSKDIEKLKAITKVVKEYTISEESNTFLEKLSGVLIG